MGIVDLRDQKSKGELLDRNGIGSSSKKLDSFPLSCKVKNLDSKTQASGRSEWLDISNFRTEIADRNGP
jgi:hypothetical protein